MAKKRHIGRVIDRIEGADLETLKKIDGGEYLKKALENRSELNGGLFLSSLIAVRERVVLASGGVVQKVRAYMNGILSSNQIAFAAGVENFAREEAPDRPETQKIAIRHDGSAKIGELHVDAQGRMQFISEGSISFLDEQRVPRFEVSVKDIPTLESLRSSSEINASAVNAQLDFPGNSQTHTFPNAITVARDGSELTIEGRISAHAHAESPNSFCSVWLSLSLVNAAGVIYTSIASVEATAYTPGAGAPFLVPVDGLIREHDNAEKFIDSKIVGVPAGVYRLRANYIKNVSGGGSGVGMVRQSTIRSKYRVDKRQVLIGKDGVSVFFGKDKYFHVQDRVGVPALEVGGGVRVKGEVDMGGVLCGGRTSNDTGVVAYAYGKYKEYAWGTGVKVQRTQKGKYIVHHSIGHTRYTAVASSNREKCAAVVREISTHSFEVHIIFTDWETYDSAFSWVCVGENG